MSRRERIRALAVFRAAQPSSQGEPALRAGTEARRPHGINPGRNCAPTARSDSWAGFLLWYDQCLPIIIVSRRTRFASGPAKRRRVNWRRSGCKWRLNTISLPVVFRRRLMRHPKRQGAVPRASALNLQFLSSRSESPLLLFIFAMKCRNKIGIRAPVYRCGLARVPLRPNRETTLSSRCLFASRMACAARRVARPGFRPAAARTSLRARAPCPGRCR
jgi:hypothetical protein